MDRSFLSTDNVSSINVLRLHSWRDEDSAVLPFDQASLSPSRDTLILHSNHHYATLFSMQSAKVSENELFSTPFHVPGEAPRNPPLANNIITSSSQSSFTIGLRGGTCPRDPTDALSSGSWITDQSLPPVDYRPCQRSSHVDRECSPFIADCVSFCWGSATEGYSIDRHVGVFKELLVVVGKHCLVIHGFPHRLIKVEDQLNNAMQPPGLVGKWVDWGRQHCEFVNESHDQSTPLAQKKIMGFTTFSVEPQFSKHAGNLQLSFLEGRTQPNVNKILSYCIPFHSKEFSTLVEFCKERVGEGDGSVFHHGDRLAVENVFSGPNFGLIGFFFSQTNNVLETRSSFGCFVLVCKVLQSALEWFSTIELQGASADSVSMKWSNFLFDGNHLYGLQENGHIYAWSLKDAIKVLHVDVLQNCGLQHISTLGRNGGSKGLENGSTNGSNDSVPLSGKDIPYGSETLRLFRHMTLAADSSFIAVTDSLGLVYLVSTNMKFKAVGIKSTSSRVSPSKAVGFKHIGSSLVGGLMLTDISPGKMSSKKQARVIPIDENFSSLSSAFSSKSCLSRSAISKPYFMNDYKHHMRRIFMPLDQHGTITSVCLNPFGVMQMVSIEKGIQGRRMLIEVASFSAEISDDCTPNVMQKLQVGFISEELCLPFCSQGYLYVVSKDGVYVVLPQLSLSTSNSGFEGKWWFTGNHMKHRAGVGEIFPCIKTAVSQIEHWQLEILDKALMYNDFFEVEQLAAMNGWSQHVVRLRRLQLALEYVQLDKLEQALDGLIAVGGAESGVTRVLFTAVQLILNSASGDNELVQASRLLVLAAHFATRLICQYGKQSYYRRRRWNYSSSSSIAPADSIRRLHEMSRLLEVIRKLQLQLYKKMSHPNLGKKEIGDENGADMVGQGEETSQASESSAVDDEAHDVGDIVEPSEESKDSMWLVQSGEHSSFLSSVEIFKRWENRNIDFSGIVREALRAGRLPLAVVQLHRLQAKDMVYQPNTQDTFKEVQGIGRVFAYELLCKGETANAMIVLSRLGQDMEIVLRELAFGTVSRFLRSQTVRELTRLGCLSSKDLQTFNTISTLERAYPNNSFWGSYGARQRLLPELPTITREGSLSPPNLQLSCSLEKPDDLTIGCGEIDGVILGDWNNLGISMMSQSFLEGISSGYWAGAAVWLNEWDNVTLDRVCADQETLLIEEISWEASLQSAVTRHDIQKVISLLDSIPDSALKQGELRVRLDCQDVSNWISFVTTDQKTSVESRFGNKHDNLEVDPVEVIVPKINFLAVPLGNTCTNWIKGMVQEKLVEHGIFMCSYWNGTMELISLIAKAGLLSMITGKLEKRIKVHRDTEQAIHELVLWHCVRFSLPYLMAIYLDRHSLALDKRSSKIMQAVVGDCQWALWLLLSRIKGQEYDASFANARTILAHNFRPGQLSVTSDIDEFITTVDDMAMAGGEMMALCTLMYAPVAIERCLGTGSVNRYDGPSWQCTLENLRPGLQQYPTLWHALVAACFEPDTWCFMTSSPAKSARSKPGLSIGYLQWREQIYSSACGDTSILQMMPRWLPKSVQRLIQVSVQGPMCGGHTVVHGGVLSYNGVPMKEVDPLAWEAELQKNIEDELYASSKFEERSVGVEHHLRRGRAMAAFNSLLGIRLQNLNAQGSLIREHVGKFQKGQLHMSSELNALLSPLSTPEEKYLAAVLPLAITNFENPVVVASCASFLELCGLPVTMLRIDVAALCRIADYCKTQKSSDLRGDWSNMYGNDTASSLARSLADEYVRAGLTLLIHKRIDAVGKNQQTRKSSQVLMEVLKMLEKASFTDWERSDGSPGSWLMNGIGDGFQLRGLQKEASDRWSLVTAFCNIHQLPNSTVYLTSLARDNDWVGFLAEAQSEGCPLEVLISVASKEFTDSRLQSHILTVLRSLQTTWQRSTAVLASCTMDSRIRGSLLSNAAASTELFEILAECEHQKNSGTALLTKAKDLRWPLLAVVASCFMDVTPVSCLTVWLEITAARETSLIKVNDAAAHIANCVGAAVEATNALPESSHVVDLQYNRKSSKRRRLSLHGKHVSEAASTTETTSELRDNLSDMQRNPKVPVTEKKTSEDKDKIHCSPSDVPPYGGKEEQESLSMMLAILCEQQRFFPLLKAFELFMPSSSLLPFIRFLQAFSQMRISDASAHLALFSTRLKDELFQSQQTQKGGKISTAWITRAAVTVANTMLRACPSAYERRCLLQLLAGADFGDGGVASQQFRRLYWKLHLAEPALQQKSDSVALGTDIDDHALLLDLEKQRKWEDARSWARQLEVNGQNRNAVNHVTESQAEAMVSEWKEYLWDLKEERVALWNHCQKLFLKHSFPPLQAGMFFLKHAEAVEQEVSPSELHGILLLALQWLSGLITSTPPSYPIHQLRELETRIWLLAVESQVELQSDKGKKTSSFIFELANLKLNQDTIDSTPMNIDPINLTANSVSVVDNHIKFARTKSSQVGANERVGTSRMRQSNMQEQSVDAVSGTISKLKRKPRNYTQHRRAHVDKPAKVQVEVEGNTESSEIPSQKADIKVKINVQEDSKGEASRSEDRLLWENRVGEQELERAVLSLLEVGQVSAARQLQQKLAPVYVPLELLLVETALMVASLSTPTIKGCIDSSDLNPSVYEHLVSSNLLTDLTSATPFEVLEALTNACQEGCGRGSCRRIKAVAHISNFLDIPFAEAFERQPTQLLQLLSLKAQESLAEAKLLVETHPMPAASIAKILAESYFKGLLAAHRGGFMESSLREEGPSPLLWRPSDFLKWAELCQSEPEMGHALLNIAISGHEVPHSCEVELLIRAHHFYMSSACLDGIDVLLSFAATRVEAYISEGDFASLARLVTGINNFQSLHFMLDILIENGQLELLLQKRAVVEAAMESSASVRGFRMAVLSTLKHFSPHDLASFTMVYKQFDMKHEMAALLESRARGLEHCLESYDAERNNCLLDMMRDNVEAAEVWASVDAGNKARWNCAQASLISLQLRIPEVTWLNLSETKARRLFVEQFRFQEALVVAEAYNLNQPSEWAPVLWNLMRNAGWVDQFLSEFVAALPLPATMLMELAKFHHDEVAARQGQIDFSWLTPAGLPLESTKYQVKSFKCLLKYVRDMRLRVQLATLATGFPDVLDVCMRILDKVPETAGPLILRKGHGGGYLPLM